MPASRDSAEWKTPSRVGAGGIAGDAPPERSGARRSRYRGLEYPS